MLSHDKVPFCIHGRQDAHLVGTQGRFIDGEHVYKVWVHHEFFFNLYICSKLITESFLCVRSCLCCVEDMESRIWAQSLWNLYVVEETDETQHSKAQVVMQEESQQIKGFSGGSWLQN